MGTSPELPDSYRHALRSGQVIPACPLALDERRRWSERHQRALLRYYAAAGAGGIAIGVHTTQFAIREPEIGLYAPLLALASDELDHLDQQRGSPLIRVGGICGDTAAATHEAAMLREHGFHCGLLSLAALSDADDDRLIEHCAHVGREIPLMGFYLQPAVGGRVLSSRFWRLFLELDAVVGIKIAPFNRYRTLDVARAVAASGRHDVALYTGNDDNIILDLLTPFRFNVNGKRVERRIVGGLLGQWAVWTRRAVELLNRCHEAVASGTAIPVDLLRINAELTDANAAIFDAANDFAGCVVGIHEILRRQGLLPSNVCLDVSERLSPGQTEEIDRICRDYPHLIDDSFVREHLSEWLAD